MRRSGSTARWSNASAALVASVFMVLAVLGAALAPPATAASTLDRIRQTGKLTIGFREDARPFSFLEGSEPSGFSIDLCKAVAEEVKTQAGIPNLTIEWVPVTVETRFEAVKQGQIDLLCSADTATLTRRGDVSFSLPFFPSGIAALVRSDSPPALRDVLLGKPQTGPIWRASPARILEGKTFAVVKGTSGETWLNDRINDFQLTAKVVPVETYEDGVQLLLDRGADVFFGDRAIVADALADEAQGNDLVVLDRLFTFEPIALGLAWNNDDFRLMVDKALSKTFRTPDFRHEYAKWFGVPDESVLTFYRQSTLPD
ncbi:MAG TPA: amino acid ABC transporter substrate-binding protein [Rhizobiaceae bacterium]